ncbi:MAG TPA: DUF2809 domain-containing protein [Pyrinomonadaceae bacterium]|nr:DUF2809 domain-containing protein [Pyrinomonadaceae bacterium]
MILTFNKNYLFLTVVLFLTEVFIALFVNDQFVRPFVGDVLVVILIYCFLRIFLNFSYLKIAFGVLIFAFTIEFLQYFDFVKIIGFEYNLIISVALGRTFSPFDLLAYLVGFILIIAAERYFSK